MNKCCIVGNLTRDPELRSTRDGVPVCSFTVAVNRRQKGAEAGKQDADFFRVTAWRELGESCGKYLAKGRKVSVVGSVSVSTYNAQDGSVHASLDVTASEVEFLTPKLPQETVGDIERKQRAAQSGYTKIESDDDLPF